MGFILAYWKFCKEGNFTKYAKITPCENVHIYSNCSDKVWSQTLGSLLWKPSA